MSILYIRDKNGNFIQMPSVPGKSAYEIAVAKGTFSGTEQEFAEMQVINNKDIIDQITQENIDNWNNTIDRIELTDSEQLVFYSGDTIISRIQLQKGMTDEEKERLDTKLSMKFDDVQMNEEETTDMQTAIDFFSDGVLVKTLYFANDTSGSITSAYISTTLQENVMVGLNENFDLLLDFVSPNLGKGTLKVFINDVESISKSIGQGESTTVIEGHLFSKGNNRVVVYVLDRVGVMSNSLTFYIRYGGTEISSDFDAYSAYDYGSTIRYYFTPTAVDTSLTLTFYMSIDGTVQQGVSCVSDTRGYYTFPTNLSADSHYCEAYIIDSNGTKSNVLKFNLIILNTNTLVVASDTKNKTIEEGEQLSLDYKAYMKNNTSFITKAYVDNNLVNTGTCNADFNYYRTSSLTEGIHTIKLEVWDVTETYHDYITWAITVTPSTYEMLQPINTGAMFIGTAINKTNTDERKQYFVGQDQEGNEVLGTLTNFAYNSESGWVNDELIISGNSHVEIPIQPLANNARYGFTLDIEFTSKQIGVADAEVLTLWNDETNCGIKITTEKLILQSSNGNKCDLYFTDNERTHVMFIIDRQELKAKIYLNGVMCEAFHLNDYTVDGVTYLDDFTVNSNISLGGYNKNGYCKIRNLRVYEVALTTDEILNNWMSCEIDKTKQKELVEFQKGEHLPTLYVYCDFSGLGKDDKKPCKIVYQSTDVEKYGESFILDHKKSQLQYQGTSSMAYPIKNYRLNLRDENGKKWYYNFPGGQGECRFTLKADFMSSGHWTNTGMAKFINNNLYNYNSNNEKSINPFRWYHVQNGDDVSKYRETINGFPCRLILVNDGETPLNEGQNEPTPGNTKDMGIFNFNNDKDNVATLGFDSDIFPNCASYEVTANSDTSAGAFMSYKSNPIIEIAKQTISGTEYYASMYMGPLLSSDSIVKTDAEIPAAMRYGENVFGIFGNTIAVTKQDEGIYKFTHNNVGTHYRILFNVNTCPTFIEINGVRYNVKIVEEYPENVIKEPYVNDSVELAYLKESFELRHPNTDDVSEDWGFMGVETDVKHLDYWIASNKMTTTIFSYSDTSIEVTGADVSYISCYGENGYIASALGSNGIYTMRDGTTKINITFTTSNIEKFYINGVMHMPGTVANMNTIRESYDSISFDTSYGLKALIDWVDNCTDEEFVNDFEEHFHKDYTLRYFCLVTLIGAVDNLGKNMMLDTADNKIFFPRFYDIDTICSYDNSGQLKFDVDIEMEQGYWNTSSSRLWTRIRDLMHDDIVATYNNMRQNGVSYENMMHYIYDEQIAKIPQTYYNKDYDIKYAPFADSYIGMAHGDTYEHVKRWLKQRFTFVDTLFDYAPSYNNDVLTIRANTTELMTLEIETYTPVYQHLSWYNGQMDKKKIDGKVSVEFSGTAQAATDQEVLIYGGSNIKSIKGITSMNPNRMLIGSATKLVEIDAHDCPLLADINANKANLSPHEYLNKVDLSNCPLLEGNLRLNNSPLVQEINIKGTNITGMNLPSSIRNLKVLRLPNTMTELTLNDAGMLHTLEFDKGVNLQSISMTNCNALENVINFDLLQTPSITLNNSYNTVAELYFRDTTNLSLSNMSNLERVIFTPNNEYDTFELINVANAPDYKVTTFNCPKLSTFMTTAPYRASYNDCGMTDKEVIMNVELLDGNYTIGGHWDDSGSYTNSGARNEIVFIENTDITYHLTVSEPSVNNYIFRVNYFNGDTFISRQYYTLTLNTTWDVDLSVPDDCNKIILAHGNTTNTAKTSLTCNKIELFQVKDYGNIHPNTTFTANSIDISSTQFTDVKLLCTTDTNILKLPTTVKNFYCDSSFDLDTNYLEDGEYDVVHGELVEQYTTDYEGEVSIGRPVTEPMVWNTGNFNTIYPSISHGNNYSEKIYVEEGSKYTVSAANNGSFGSWFKAFGFDKSDTVIWQYGGGGTGDTTGRTGTIPSGVVYVRFARIDGADAEITYTESYTPNLIPSSADGSLIFSMYAPSNTVAPASGTWDLHGLEFDNFHTFGMNNDVEVEYGKCVDYFYEPSFSTYITSLINVHNFNQTICVDSINGSKYARYIYFYDKDGTCIGNNYDFTGVTADIPSDAEYISVSIKYTNTIDDAIGVSLNGVLYKLGEQITDGDTIKDFYNEPNPTSITMPARYDDYNITIKNANISPKTHNTMLYPLLVNEDNPITGTLDYTDYAGKHLSWSFAYTDEENVNIIQPKDELLNSYDYEYNAFYDTEYEFDNPYEVARYTSNASGVLPNFDAQFTYTYEEIDNEDGTYTTKIYADSLDKLPTLINFIARPIISVDKLNTSQATNLQSLFQSCNKLERVDTRYWDTSKVITMKQAFFNTYVLTSLDISNLNMSNVKDIADMFNGSGLTEIIGLNNWNTSNVVDMSNMFYSCNNLTSINLSSFDTSNVTSMSNMFYGCSKLTSLDVSSFDTGEVTNMSSMFQGCNNLTSINLSSFDTSNVTNMSNMFYGCKSLTSLDLSKWDASKVVNMYQTFRECSSITELNLSGFTNVKDWGSFCRYCTNLVGITGLDTSKYSSSFGGNDSRFLSFQGCTSLRNIKNLDVSFTSAMAKAYSNSITDGNDYWILIGWGWFNGLTNLVDITFTGQLELYDTLSIYPIFKGCDTSKFTYATWNTFVSILPTTSTSKSIVLGKSQAILDAVPDEIKLALTQKGYTLTFWG